MSRQIAHPAGLGWSSGASIKRVFRGFIADLFIALIIALLVVAGVWVLAVALPWKTGASDTWLARVCQWLYDGNIGMSIRESLWVFPILEGTHLLGIGLSVGMVCWFDLRLLGLVLRDEPVSKVWKQVMPAAFVGFALMFATGALLFWAEALTAYHSIHFWIKIGLLALAGVNALIFESTAHRNMVIDWDTAPVPPLHARMIGLISLVLWTAIIVTGRTMAYTF
jgi:hypothetical protein